MKLTEMKQVNQLVIKCDSLWEKGALHSNKKNWVFYANKKLQFIST